MKHCVDEFIEQQGSKFRYSCVCGRCISTPQPLPEDGDGIEVEVAADGPGSCPECFPERVVAKLDGVALHPDLGGLETDEEVVEEDHGEE
jgi:hypothetical protein